MTHGNGDKRAELLATELAGARAQIAELTRANSALEGITNAIPDPIFLKDREGRCLFANPATLKLLGKSLDQILGRTDWEIHDDAGMAQMLVENEQRVMASGVAEIVEETVRTASGDSVLLTSKVPLRDLDGRVIGLVGCARDITDRKRAEEALRKSQEALRLSESQMAVAQQIGHTGSWVYDLATGGI